jgi:hypothetical protein
MQLALLYVFQAKSKEMTPFTAIAVIRALAQDGYVVIERARYAALVEAAQKVLEYGHIRPFADAARDALRAALEGEPR